MLATGAGAGMDGVQATRNKRPDVALPERAVSLREGLVLNSAEQRGRIGLFAVVSTFCESHEPGVGARANEDAAEAAISLENWPGTGSCAVEG